MVFHVNGNDHSGYWNWHTNTPASDMYAEMNLYAGDFGSTRCVDTWLDWWTHGSGHWDARSVRVCKPGGQRSSPAFDQAIPHSYRDFDGVQKLGMCMYEQDNHAVAGCVNDPDVDPDQTLGGADHIVPVVPNFVTFTWIRWQGGAIDGIGYNYPLDPWR